MCRNVFDAFTHCATAEVCDDWLGHVERATESRKEYRKDTDTFPVMASFMSPLIWRKLICCLGYLESRPQFSPDALTCIMKRLLHWFHPRDQKQWKEKKLMRNVKPLGMIWHEGIQGRMDVASTVIKC